MKIEWLMHLILETFTDQIYVGMFTCLPNQQAFHFTPKAKVVEYYDLGSFVPSLSLKIKLTRKEKFDWLKDNCVGAVDVHYSYHFSAYYFEREDSACMFKLSCE